MTFSVHQPQYIPWLGYFDKIAKSDYFVFLDSVQYKPREFQNRNKIRTKKGSSWLTVPAICKGKRCQMIRDVIIDNSQPWQRKHLNSIKESYATSPFFKDYIPFFENVYSRKWERILDLNVYIIKYILEKIHIRTPVCLESQLGTKNTATYRIVEIAKKLNADTYLSGIGGKDYLEEEKFADNGIKIIYQNFTHPVYHQQFMPNENDFIPYMSILDLLFSEGHKAKRVLELEGV